MKDFCILLPLYCILLDTIYRFSQDCLWRHRYLWQFFSIFLEFIRWNVLFVFCSCLIWGLINFSIILVSSLFLSIFMFSSYFISQQKKFFWVFGNRSDRSLSFSWVCFGLYFFFTMLSMVSLYFLIFSDNVCWYTIIKSFGSSMSI